MQNSHFNVLLTIEEYMFLTPSVASISAMHSFNDFPYSFEMTIAMAEWSTEVEKKVLDKV
ncbi:hypothetical protein ACLIKE_08325 [Ferroplasma acidiphilum]|uniref:Uncharacterized protein n=2 Tax=Ferroplasma TaxID=74968 RepID=S0AS09_FERAC|nr:MULTISPECIES: hypothetical protein [Ferroplasma]AGO60779.1 hypothetical protein FACI_IFERC00001G0799 [Ferroplasma acidarmanus Fer1]NOL60412.1 hypothetical protein [Ferroplasma acidiphilum]WMT52667.1 MAG: hypothetical protein RE473_06565 [Ferroplasma acidiphilum]